MVTVEGGMRQETGRAELLALQGDLLRQFVNHEHLGTPCRHGKDGQQLVDAIRIGGLVDADSDLSGFELTKIDVTHFGQIFHAGLRYIFRKLQFQRVEKAAV